MMWRAALTAITAAAAGLEYGRRAAARAVDAEAAETTAAAIAEARARIAEEARRVAATALRRFWISTAIKSAIALALWLAWRFGWINGDVFVIGFAAAVALFFLRDIYITWPTLRLIYGELRRSDWRPREALADYAARRTAEEARQRADNVELGLKAKIALALAGRSKSAMAKEIAETTAAAVRETSWSDVRPMAAAAAVKASLGFALYSVFIAVLASSVG